MTETLTYERLTGIHAFNGFKSLRIGQRYTGVPQEEYRAGGANEGGCDGEQRGVGEVVCESMIRNVL